MKVRRRPGERELDLLVLALCAPIFLDMPSLPLSSRRHSAVLRAQTLARGWPPSPEARSHASAHETRTWLMKCRALSVPRFRATRARRPATCPRVEATPDRVRARGASAGAD